MTKACGQSEQSYLQPNAPPTSFFSGDLWLEGGGEDLEEHKKTGKPETQPKKLSESDSVFTPLAKADKVQTQLTDRVFGDLKGEPLLRPRQKRSSPMIQYENATQEVTSRKNLGK